ncbi:uncharacterized protein LOC116609437 isoform X2 [Nematostella vectensis]|uniref:uncharacterized protein LOC116609437 isoform X2 n=1 Tax=Nematostella vectensis TaxID=45351 RepID=UPI0020776C05|nr:uncharacterized protein LOC116609437 isoform X2 [Nematostella vectensis]
MAGMQTRSYTLQASKTTYTPTIAATAIVATTGTPYMRGTSPNSTDAPSGIEDVILVFVAGSVPSLVILCLLCFLVYNKLLAWRDRRKIRGNHANGMKNGVHRNTTRSSSTINSTAEPNPSRKHNGKTSCQHRVIIEDNSESMVMEHVPLSQTISTSVVTHAHVNGGRASNKRPLTSSHVTAQTRNEKLPLTHAQNEEVALTRVDRTEDDPGRREEDTQCLQGLEDKMSKEKIRNKLRMRYLLQEEAASTDLPLLDLVLACKTTGMPIDLGLHNGTIESCQPSLTSCVTIETTTEIGEGPLNESSGRGYELDTRVKYKDKSVSRTKATSQTTALEKKRRTKVQPIKRRIL